MAGANPCSSPAFPAERLWQAFSAVGTFPRREVAEARESWSTISAIFLERFQSYVRDPQGHKKDADSLLIALHLFAEMRDTRIYRPLLAWACASPAALDSALGDAITETLNQVICGVARDGPQRSVSLRQREKVQEVLPRQAGIAGDGVPLIVNLPVPRPSARAFCTMTSACAHR